MDLRKLEIFVAVAERGNFSQAASHLHMAQPAVSIAVRKLEDELRLTLFDRSQRQIKLTSEGQTLLGRARSILAEVEALRRDCGSLHALLQGELSIACPSMLATYYLPDLLSAFLREHPGLRAAVTQSGTARVEQMLLADEIEIGVTAGNASAAPELDSMPLLREHMVLCMRRDHPWARKRSVPVEKLHESPMVVYEGGYFIRSQLDQLCARQNVTPHYRMQSNFLPLLINMVKQGLGTTVGLNVMVQQETGLVGVPLSPATEVQLNLSKRRGRTISRANQAFLDWVAFTI